MKWLLVICILVVALLQLSSSHRYRHRWRHRHRHRHRHRLYKQVFLNDMDLPNCDSVCSAKMLQEFEDQLDTLSDGLTLREDVSELARNNVTFPKTQDFREIVRTQQRLLTDITVDSLDYSTLEIKVLDSISRTLNFYQSQLDEIKKGDSALSLKMLKDIDDKHGKVLQQRFPLGELIRKSTDSGTTLDQLMVRQWKNRSGSRTDYWKPASVLQSHLDRIDDGTLVQVGDEKEGLWGKVNAECQDAVVSRCEIPHICERVLLDPVPRSQYLLTHQIFQQLIIDNSNCPNLQQFVSSDDEHYTKLCTKAYLEAQYLDMVNVPINQRDLFAELVGFCGYLGYTNFLRLDWFERILSWQSDSESGCFVEDPLTPAGLLTTDMGFQRKATEMEVQAGVLQANEQCLPHLTAVSLTAVTVFWDYLMDVKYQRIVEHSEL